MSSTTRNSQGRQHQRVYTAIPERVPCYTSISIHSCATGAPREGEKGLLMVADVYSGVDFGEKNVLSENSQNCRYTELHDHEYIASVFELSDPASYGSIQVQECRQRALLALAGARANTLWLSLIHI